MSAQRNGRPTREQMAAVARRPGGRGKILKLRDTLEGNRAGIVEKLEAGKASMAKMQTAMADLQALVDNYDGALADIASLLGEVAA